LLEELQAQLKMERKNMDSETVKTLDGILRNHESFFEAATLTNNSKIIIPIYKTEEKDGTYVRSETTDVVLELYQEDVNMGAISPVVKQGKFGLILRDNRYRLDMTDISSYNSEENVETVFDAETYFSEKFGHDQLNQAYLLMSDERPELPTEVFRQANSSSLDFLTNNKYEAEVKTHFDDKITSQDIEYSVRAHLDDLNFKEI